MNEILYRKLLAKVPESQMEYEISKISIYGLFGNLKEKTEINFGKKIQIGGRR